MGGGGGGSWSEGKAQEAASTFDSLPDSTKERCLSILKALEKRQKRRMRVRSRRIHSDCSSSSDSNLSNALVFGGAMLAGFMGSDDGDYGCGFDSGDSFDSDYDS